MSGDGSVPGANHPLRALKEWFPGRPGTTNYLVNWSPGGRYIYVEIPKAGCTTVKRFLQLAETRGDASGLSDNPHDKGASPVCSPGDDPDAFFKAISDPDVFRFAFVRNPFSRALSCYLDKIVGIQWERDRRLPQLGFATDAHPTFEEFLMRVAEQEPAAMDIHWAPQTFLLGLPAVRYDFLGRFETFQDDLGRVAIHLGLGEYFESVRRDRPHATGASARLRQHFTPAAADLVRGIYSEDFERLGYGYGPFVV